MFAAATWAVRSRSEGVGGDEPLAALDLLARIEALG
jgi:hypothetical protein